MEPCLPQIDAYRIAYRPQNLCGKTNACRLSCGVAVEAPGRIKVVAPVIWPHNRLPRAPCTCQARTLAYSVPAGNRPRPAHSRKSNFGSENSVCVTGNAALVTRNFVSAHKSRTSAIAHSRSAGANVGGPLPMRSATSSCFKPASSLRTH